MKNRCARPSVAVIPLILLAAALGICDFLFRYCGRIAEGVNGAPQLVQSLAQLEEARIQPHILLPVLLCAGYGLILWRFGRKKALMGILGAAVFLLSVLSALLLTTVNGVRTLELLRVFVPLFQNGLAEIL